MKKSIKEFIKSEHKLIIKLSNTYQKFILNNYQYSLNKFIKKYYVIKPRTSYIHRDKDDERNLIFKNIAFENIKIISSEIIINDKIYKFIEIFKSMQIKKISFIDCTFKETIFKASISYCYVMKNCFTENLFFKNILVSRSNGNIIEKGNNIEIVSSTFQNIEITNSDFSDKFYIKSECKKTTIHYLNIQNSIFYNNFKLHDSRVMLIDINNVDFIKNADFFQSKFLQEEKRITFKAINFEKLALFGECEFHSMFVLRYVTISGLSHFREAVFFAGLNLDKTNIEKEINFFDIKGIEEVSETNKTSQETYRIMKHNCEKIGNIIEANRYHALELEKKKEKLSETEKITQTSITFWLNWKASKFGTNWVYPLIGIFTIGILTTLGVNYDRLGDLYSPIDLINGEIFFKGIDKAFEYMYILNKDKKFQDFGFIFLLNKILLGYLYYQFVTAVRKDTRK